VKFLWPDLKVPIDQDEALLPHLLAKRLNIPLAAIRGWRIVRRSLDARKKPELYFAYSLEFSLDVPPKQRKRILDRNPRLKVKPESPERIIARKPERKLTTRPIIVVTGPAGYFAALALAERGYRPLVLERGPGGGRRCRGEHLANGGPVPSPMFNSAKAEREHFPMGNSRPGLTTGW
jgi:uncharacterized FAD-dependent dehydrogenase